MTTRFPRFVLVALVLATALHQASPLIAGEPPRPRGPRVEIPNATQGDQVRPTVDSSSNGNFVVSWQSDIAAALAGGPEQAIFSRSFAGRDGAPIGAEVLVGIGERPAMAVADNGVALTAWEVTDEDGSGLQGRMCQAGSCQPSFPINLTTIGDQKDPQVVATPSGAFLVVWQSSGQDSDLSSAIVGRLFPPPGAVLFDSENGAGGLGEFVVNALPEGEQSEPFAAFSRVSQRFSVGWHGPTGSGNGIAARIVDPVNGPVGPDIVVAPNNAVEGALAIEPGGQGQHFFAWVGDDVDGSGIIGRRTDALMTTASSPFRVNQVELGNQHTPAVAADVDGGATFVWVSAEPASPDHPLLGSPIFLKGIKGSGSLGSPFAEGGQPPAHFSFEFEVSGGGGLQHPQIGGDPTGNFVVAWEQDAGPDVGVFVRRYGALIFEDGFETGDISSWSNSP